MEDCDLGGGGRFRPPTSDSMEDLEPQYDLSEVGFPISEPVPYFALIVREPNKIRLVNVGPEVVRCVQEKLQQLVKVEKAGYVIFKVSQRLPGSRTYSIKVNFY